MSITRADYRNLYPPKNFYITDKADGKRAIAIIQNGKAIIITNSIIEGSVINHDSKYQLDTILDGEYVAAPRRTLLPEGAPYDSGNFYAFDIIAINGISLVNKGFEERVTYLENACILLTDLGISAESKPFTSTNVEDLESLITGVYERERPYEKDGLIFVESGKSYIDTKTYKWKPAHSNTIDFLVKKAPSNVLGKYPFIEKEGHQIYFLFVGINNEMFESLALQWCPGYSQIFQKSISSNNSQRNYFPIQFSPSDVPLAYIYHMPVLAGGRLDNGGDDGGDNGGDDYGDDYDDNGSDNGGVLSPKDGVKVAFEVEEYRKYLSQLVQTRYLGIEGTSRISQMIAQQVSVSA